MKLKIENVKFKNFLSFGSREQEVILNKGVNIVLGKDVNKNKSNGAGKCVFGAALLNIKCDKIIEKILQNI